METTINSLFSTIYWFYTALICVVLLTIIVLALYLSTRTERRDHPEMRYLTKYLSTIPFVHHGAREEDIYPGLKYLQLRVPHEFSGALVLQGHGLDYSMYHVIAEIGAFKDENDWTATVAVELLNQASEFVFVIPCSTIGARITRLTTTPESKGVVTASNLSRSSRRAHKKNMKQLEGETRNKVTPLKKAGNS